MSIVYNNMRSLDSAMAAAYEGRARRLGVYDRLFDAYSGFLSAVERKGVSAGEAAVRFAGKVTALGRDLFTPMEALAARPGGPSGVAADRYVASMLHDCLLNGPDGDASYASGILLEALGADCSFDGPRHAFFRTESQYFVLDKEDASLRVFAKGAGPAPADVVQAPAGKGRKAADDPVFHLFLEKYYPGVMLAWEASVGLVRHAPERTMAAMSRVAGLQYSGDTVAYRKGIVDVIRAAAPLGVRGEDGRFLELEVPGMDGVRGILFRDAGSTSSVELRFRDGSSLRPSEMSTGDLKNVKEAVGGLVRKLKVGKSGGVKW